MKSFLLSLETPLAIVDPQQKSDSISVIHKSDLTVTTPTISEISTAQDSLPVTPPTQLSSGNTRNSASSGKESTVSKYLISPIASTPCTKKPAPCARLLTSVDSLAQLEMKERKKLEEQELKEQRKRERKERKKKREDELKQKAAERAKREEERAWKKARMEEECVKKAEMKAKKAISKAEESRKKKVQSKCHQTVHGSRQHPHHQHRQNQLLISEATDQHQQKHLKMRSTSTFVVCASQSMKMTSYLALVHSGSLVHVRGEECAEDCVIDN